MTYNARQSSPLFSLEQLKTARALTRAGAEYELLPWILAQGALCQLQVVIIEWHLNRLPPHKRLSALAIRLSFHTFLHAACARPPALIEHDEPWEGNTMVVVPGLYQRAARHSNPVGRVPYHTRRYLAADARYLKGAAKVDCGSRPRCAGTASNICQWDRLECSFGHTTATMKEERKAHEKMLACGSANATARDLLAQPSDRAASGMR